MNRKKYTLHQLWAYVCKNKHFLWISIVLSMVSVAVSLYQPILIGEAVDLLIGKGQVDFSALGSRLAGIALTVLVIPVSQYFASLCNQCLSYSTAREIRGDLFAHLQKLPVLWLDAHPTGDIVSCMVTDVDQLTDGLLISFTQLLTGIATIIGTLVLMFVSSPLVALVVAGLTPLSMLTTAFIAGKSHKLFAEQAKLRGEQTALTHEMIHTQKLIRAYGYEEPLQQRYDSVNEALGRCSMQATFISSLTNPSTRFVNALVYAGVCLSGALSVISGKLTVGKLSAMLSYATRYAKPFNEISSVITELQGALACADRVFALLAEEEESPEPSASLTRNPNQISVEKLNFSYTGDENFLKDISFQANKGMKVAIVGPTGCGKTTLINLMMRFFEPCSGCICMDGQNIAAMSRSSLRSHYGMVLQDTWIQKKTVRENLCMARPDVTEAEMISAAKRTRAHSFICRLPEGYDTLLGESNVTLSEGQKQLLCITRVLLAVPDILLLDEATSSLDTHTEVKVQQAFDELMKGRTSFVVAHRLSTIRNADLILVMQDGRILEEGTHAELLRKGGLYARLYQCQFAPG